MCILVCMCLRARTFACVVLDVCLRVNLQASVFVQDLFFPTDCERRGSYYIISTENQF